MYASLSERKLASLRVLIAQLVPANRFYADRLGRSGIDEGIGSLEEFTRRMPFTTKHDLVKDQRDNPPYGSNLTYGLSEYSRFSRTSSTSGNPITWLDTAPGWEWMLQNWMRVFEAAGVTAGDVVYFAFSFGPFLGFWTAFEAATRIGSLCIPGGGLSSAQRLHALVEHKVSSLCCTPTYALHLGEVAQVEQIDLRESSVKVIIVAGEPGGSIPSVREKVRSLWFGARLFDHYGMTEVGPVAYEDPEQSGRLKVIEESYFAEVIDPESGQPVPQGEIGELVLTTLGRTGSPLLRYRTGDLVRPIGATDGETPTIFQGGILSRADDVIHVRGVNLYPSAVDEVVRSFPGILEYQVEIGERDALVEISIRAEFKEENRSTEARGELEKALRNAFNLRIPVKAVTTGTLPRPELKARRWVRK